MAQQTRQFFWLSDENRSEDKATNMDGLDQKNAAPLALPMNVASATNTIKPADIQTLNIIREFNWTNTDAEHRDLHINDIGNQLAGTQDTFAVTAGIPAIILNEYRVTFSSALANLRYQIDALKSAPAIMKSGINLIKNAVGQTAGTTAAQGVSWVGEKLVGISDTAVNVVGDVVATATPQFNARNPSDSNQIQANPHLAPYAGLYLGAPSGFRYIFPYLTSDQYRTSTNQWTAEGNSAIQDFVGTVAGGVKYAGDMGKRFGNAFQSIPGVQAVGDAVGGAGELAAKAITAPLDVMGAGLDLTINATRALTPGHSLESTMTYTGYGQGNHQVNVKFYLSNTMSFEEVVRNWHLMFLLQYQNQPNKNNKVSLEPPVMYEVSIPGHYYSPFAFISGLVVRGLGNTKTMEIPLRTKLQPENVPEAGLENVTPVFSDRMPAIQGTDIGSVNHGSLDPERIRREIGFANKSTPGSRHLPKSVVVPIPEAYEVTIQIQSMVADSKNFSYHTLKNTDSIYTASLAKTAAQGQNQLFKGIETANTKFDAIPEPKQE